MQPGSIAFVVVTPRPDVHSAALLEPLWRARRDGDEFVLLTRAELAAHARPQEWPWLRVVGVPGAHTFLLRSLLPTLSECEWLFVLEDHTLVGAPAVAAVRELIRTRPELDLIAMLAKNLTSLRPWDWAGFLHGLAPVWAPLLRGEPPFALVTSVVVRRAALGTAPLPLGAWELRRIPSLFASGRHTWSNEIFVDHVKALSAAQHLRLQFHNNRVCAAFQRRLGMPSRTLVQETWNHALKRPPRVAEAIGARFAELPRGTLARIRTIALVSALGILAGTFFGPAGSLDELD